MSATVDWTSELQQYREALRSETELHWQRNSYFLVVASIIILALSQFHMVPYIQILLSFVGFVLSAAWMMITYRSDKYVGYWKERIRNLEDTLGLPNLYPANIGGLETRKIVYVLPLVFLVLWGTIIGLLSAGSLRF